MRRHVISGASLTAIAAVVSLGYAWSAPAKDSIPVLGGREFAWNVNFWDYQLYPPTGSVHGPMKTDPAYPYNSQIQNRVLVLDDELTVSIMITKEPVLELYTANPLPS